MSSDSGSSPKSVPPTSPHFAADAAADHLFTATTPCSRSRVAPYCERARGVVTPERFAHIVRVAILADAIGRSNDFSESELLDTALAAVLHDVARDLPTAEMFELAPPQGDLEREHPLAVHGRAGRVLAERWGVSDERVLEAIAGHVFGVPVANRVGMAVYVADVSEPGRGVNNDIRELAMHDLLGAYRCAVDSKVRYLRSQGKSVHPHTLEVYEKICNAS